MLGSNILTLRILYCSIKRIVSLQSGSNDCLLVIYRAATRAGLQMAFNDFSFKGYLYWVCNFVPPTLTTAYVGPWDVSIFQNTLM
jgi:hypothetical protein